MHALQLVLLGATVLLGAWVPLFISNLPLSLGMIAVAAGYLLPLPGLYGPAATFTHLVEPLAQIALVAAVYGAGLSIDRSLEWRKWTSAARLLLLVMPITIAVVAGIAMWVLGQPIGMAVILAALLAPTDPVLASDVQVGPPGSGDEPEVPFALTTEASLNDGLALPFVVLGLSLLNGQISTSWDLLQWASLELVGRTVYGAALGIVSGWALVRLSNLFPEPYRLRRTENGIVGIGIALVVFGMCELAGANALVAVFFHAVSSRRTASGYNYSRRLAQITRQIEHALLAALMILLGYAVGQGALDGVTWPDALVAVLALVAVRVPATLVGFLGSPVDVGTRFALGFLGIRGISSLYYLAFCIDRLPLAQQPQLIAVTSLTVILSVFLFGATGRPVVKAVNRTPSEERK